MTKSVTLAGLPHAGANSKPHLYKQKVQKVKDLPKTWVLRGKHFEDFRRKKNTSSLDQTTAEEAIETAPRMLPSSVFEDLRFGRALPFFFLLNFRSMWAATKLVKSSFWQKLPISLFTSVAREVFFFCPARDWAFKQILGNKRSRRQ